MADFRHPTSDILHYFLEWAVQHKAELLKESEAVLNGKLPSPISPLN